MNDIKQYFLGAIVENRVYPFTFAKICDYQVTTKGILVGLSYQLFSNENYVDEMISLQELEENWTISNSIMMNESASFSKKVPICWSNDSEMISFYLSQFHYDSKKREAILDKYRKLHDEVSLTRSLKL